MLEVVLCVMADDGTDVGTDVGSDIDQCWMLDVISDEMLGVLLLGWVIGSVQVEKL